MREALAYTANADRRCVAAEDELAAATTAMQRAEVRLTADPSYVAPQVCGSVA